MLLCNNGAKKWKRENITPKLLRPSHASISQPPERKKIFPSHPHLHPLPLERASRRLHPVPLKRTSLRPRIRVSLAPPPTFLWPGIPIFVTQMSQIMKDDENITFSDINETSQKPICVVVWARLQISTTHNSGDCSTNYLFLVCIRPPPPLLLVHSSTFVTKPFTPAKWTIDALHPTSMLWIFKCLSKNIILPNPCERIIASLRCNSFHLIYYVRH